MTNHEIAEEIFHFIRPYQPISKDAREIVIPNAYECIKKIEDALDKTSASVDAYTQDRESYAPEQRENKNCDNCASYRNFCFGCPDKICTGWGPRVYRSEPIQLAPSGEDVVDKLPPK